LRSRKWRGWDQSHVRRILANSKYVGVWDFGKTTTIRSGSGKKKQVKAKASQRSVTKCRPHLRLPPYSPDYNPIEMAISKMKAVIRKQAQRSINTLEDAIGEATRSITPQDARNFIRHCHYAMDE